MKIKMLNKKETNLEKLRIQLEGKSFMYTWLNTS